MESKKIGLVVVVAMVLALTLAQSSFARMPYPFILDAIWVDDQTMMPGELVIERKLGSCYNQCHYNSDCTDGRSCVLFSTKQPGSCSHKE
ncbi:unnamed protein product [Dovyalis caffra]|uniref:Uncharacterized protein n=1 Tax=Dovyalis caffra TaxID=77055 RepID=A0AAV1SEJ6_9ROSI|nr:unnamed protein product [Dovyalis caffra]